MSMHNRLRRAAGVATGLAIVALLASCGGSDNGSPAAPTPVSNTPPDSASASTAGFIAYLKGLVLTMPETTEPLNVANFVAPTDDTGPYDTSI